MTRIKSGRKEESIVVNGNRYIVLGLNIERIVIDSRAEESLEEIKVD